MRHWPDKPTKQDIVQEKRPGLCQAGRVMQNDSCKWKSSEGVVTTGSTCRWPAFWFGYLTAKAMSETTEDI